MIMLNNFDLNTSPSLWTNPDEFSPERFLTESGTFRKPAHFLPFSTGKRACMGYKMVERISEGILVSILKDFDIVSLENPSILPRSCVAVHPDFDIRVQFIPREAI
jgi:cytochrome P450 family 307 subfamily A